MTGLILHPTPRKRLPSAEASTELDHYLNDPHGQEQMDSKQQNHLIFRRKRGSLLGNNANDSVNEHLETPSIALTPECPATPSTPIGVRPISLIVVATELRRNGRLLMPELNDDDVGGNFILSRPLKRLRPRSQMSGSLASDIGISVGEPLVGSPTSVATFLEDFYGADPPSQRTKSAFHQLFPHPRS